MIETFKANATNSSTSDIFADFWEKDSCDELRQRVNVMRDFWLRNGHSEKLFWAMLRETVPPITWSATITSST